MAAGDTERVLELFSGDPALYQAFRADVRADPAPAGIPESVALAVYVSYLERFNPAWTGVDVDAVDWAGVTERLAGRVTAPAV